MMAFRSQGEIVAKKSDTFDPSFRRCRSCPGVMSERETAEIREIRRTQSDAKVIKPEEVR